MARVRRIAQPVNDPEIEVFEATPALARDVADVGRVYGISNAITERRNIAVLYGEGGQRHRPALPFDGLALARLDRMLIQDWRIIAAGRRDEAIRKPVHDVFGGRLVQIDRNPPALMQHDRPQI